MERWERGKNGWANKQKAKRESANGFSTLCHTMHVRKAWQFPCCLFCCPPISFFPFLSVFFLHFLLLLLLFIRFFKYVLNSYCSHSCSTSKCARHTFFFAFHYCCHCRRCCYCCWRSEKLSVYRFLSFLKETEPEKASFILFFALSVYHFDFTFLLGNSVYRRM